MITSKDNDKIKLIRKLMTDKKTRKETGLFVLEGTRLIDEAIKSSRVEVETMYVRESFYRHYEGVTDTLHYRHSAAGCHCEEQSYEAIPCKENNNTFSLDNNNIIIVKDSVFFTITDTVNSQGVIALCRLRHRDSGRDICVTHNLLLDRIRDPGNLGAIIRTAAAAGYNIIYCIDCADPYQPKSLRASMGGILYVDIIETDYSIIDEIKKSGVSIIAADMGGQNIFKFAKFSTTTRQEELATPCHCEERSDEAIPRAKHKYSLREIASSALNPRNDKKLQAYDSFCLAIGSEAEGLDPHIKNSATLTVSIPMQNVESLNAAVSAGILMYVLKENK